MNPTTPKQNFISTLSKASPMDNFKLPVSPVSKLGLPTPKNNLTMPPLPKPMFSGNSDPKKQYMDTLIGPNKQAGPVLPPTTTPPPKTTPPPTTVPPPGGTKTPPPTTTPPPAVTPPPATTTPPPAPQTPKTPAEDYASFLESYNAGNRAIENQVIPLEDVTGQQAHMKKLYGDTLTAKKETADLEQRSKPNSALEYEYAVKQGYKGDFNKYQNDDANRKAKANGGGGVSDRLLTVAEAKSLGVPYGTTQAQAVGVRSFTGAEREAQANATSALLSLNKLTEKIGTDNPNNEFKQRKLITFGFGQIANAQRELTDVISRIRTGAALTAAEEAFYQKQVPNKYDNDATIKSKVNQLAAFYSGIAGNPVTLQLADGTIVEADDMYSAEDRLAVKDLIAQGANVINY